MSFLVPTRWRSKAVNVGGGSQVSTLPFVSSPQLATVPPGQRAGERGGPGELCGGEPGPHPHHHQRHDSNVDQRQLPEERAREVRIWRREVQYLKTHHVLKVK